MRERPRESVRGERCGGKSKHLEKVRHERAGASKTITILCACCGASSETYLSGMAQYSRKHQDCVPVPGPMAVLCICMFRMEGSIEGHVAKPFGRGSRGWYPASHVLILRRTQK